MAQADWNETLDSLSAGVVARGPTAGLTPPPGGATYVYAHNSLTNDAGAVAHYLAQVDFNPAVKGGRITGAIQRGLGTGALNVSAFLFCSLQGTSNTDKAYILGLADDDPSRVALVKGRIVDGVPAAVPGTLGVLRRSAASVAIGVWSHLRLDVILNPNGDVVLNAFVSDLTQNDVTNPTWTSLFPPFIDDFTQINTGSAPLAGGRFGWGMTSKAIGRRAYFDHIYVAKQD